MNFHTSIQNITYIIVHYCRTRWTQNNKNLCIECVVNLVHIFRLFPHHPRGKSRWRIVFFLSGCSPIGISFHLKALFWRYSSKQYKGLTDLCNVWDAIFLILVHDLIRFNKLRLFPHHPRGKSHWCIVFLAATAAQEAHLSVCPYVTCFKGAVRK